MNDEPRRNTRSMNGLRLLAAIGLLAGLSAGALAAGCGSSASSDDGQHPPATDASTALDSTSDVTGPSPEASADGSPDAAIDSASDAPQDGASSATTLQTTPIVVQAGEEGWKCQDFANPFGVDVDLATFESHSTSGMLAMIVMEVPGAADGGVADCAALDLQHVHYMTQELDGGLTYPSGVAAHVSKGNGFRVAVHYLNTTAAAINASARVVMQLAAPGSITQYGGLLFVSNSNISVPPGQHSVNYDCTLGQPLTIFAASGVMFSHGVGFAATLNDASIYQATAWSNPPQMVESPPVVAAAGAALHFACSVNNNTGSTLIFGPSAIQNEQCAFYAPFSGVLDGGPFTVSCP
jgi:hypothetical protein